MTNTNSSKDYRDHYARIIIASIACLVSVSVILFQIGTEWWFNLTTIVVIEIGILGSKYYADWKIENGRLSFLYMQWLKMKRKTLHKNSIQYKLSEFSIGDAYAYNILNLSTQENLQCTFTSLNGFSSQELQTIVRTLNTTPKKQQSVSVPQSAMKMKTADL